MPKDTPQVNHRAEAARELKELDEMLEGDLTPIGEAKLAFERAFIHSNLAIAEGQERVAEEISLLREETAGLPETLRVYLEAAANRIGGSS